MGDTWPDADGTTLTHESLGHIGHMARLEKIAALPHRNPVLHWLALAASLISLAILSFWMFGGRGQVPNVWFWTDIGLGVATTADFFTRSGFRWNPVAYFRTRFFDFIAIAPALALVNHGFAGQEVWLWLILVARGARSADRALGDGFIQRNALALVEGFEEELTDRVIERLLERTQADLARGEFGRRLSEALAKNKALLLQRIRETHPTTGVGAGLAHIVGLEHIEERTYDALIEMVGGPEVDQAIRDMIDSTFLEIRDRMATKTWKQHLGIRRRR